MDYYADGAMKRARDYRREAWVALGEGQYWPFVGALFILTLIVGAAVLPSILLLFIPLFYLIGFMSWSQSTMALATIRRRMKFFSRSDPTDRKNRMEIDFLVAKSKLTRKNNIHPIEVKSGKNTPHRSLDKFSAKYSEWLDMPYLLWTRDLAVKDGIIYLPLYMASLF